MKPPETPDTLLTEDSPVRAEWAYPQSKLDAEEVLREEHGQIPVVILQIGVYDGDGNSLPIGQHIRRIHEKQLESYMFPGHPEVHPDDLTACLRATVESRHRLEPYEVFLIAEPEVMSHQDLGEAGGAAARAGMADDSNSEGDGEDGNVAQGEAGPGAVDQALDGGLGG